MRRVCRWTPFACASYWRGVKSCAQFQPSLQVILISRFTLAFIAAALAADGWCAPAAIDTDGPDFVESSEVVGKGRFQFEADVVVERDRRNSAPITSLSAPLLLRFGVSETLELRVETEGLQRVIDHNTATIRGGAGDTAVGIKWHAQDRDPATNTPALAWILHVAGPTGTNGFQGRGAMPSLRAVFTWELPHDLALGFMPGVRYGATPSGQRYTSLISGLVLNKQWTPKWRTFIENSAPQIARADKGGVVMSWDGGAAYLVNRDWQVGFRGGFAANHNTPNRFLLVELAGRF